VPAFHCMNCFIKNILILTSLFFLPYIPLSAQEKEHSFQDTVKIKEVVVTQSIPLNDESRMKHARASFTSNIDEINARLGGVSVISRGAYAMEPMINTFSGGQINVTIDGMKMFGACTDKMDPVTSYVEPVNLKSIELDHGSNGSKNGSTIGGTFDMSLQPAERSLFRLEAGTSFKSASNGSTGYLAVNYGKEKWAYRVSGTYRNFSSYTDGNGNKVPFTQYEKVNVQQSLLFIPAAGHNLTFDWLIDDAFNVGYPALPMDVSRAKGRVYSLEYHPDGKLLSFENFRTRVYANTVYHLMDDSHRDSLFLVDDVHAGTADSVYMRMDMPGWSRTYGAFAEGTLDWTSKNRLTVKLESYRHWSKAEMTMYMNNLSNPGEPPMYAETWPENRRYVTGLFLQNSCDMTPNTRLSANVRLDYSNSKVLSEQGKQQFNALGYEVDKPFGQLVKSANINLESHGNDALEFRTGIGYGERLASSSEQFGYYLYNAMDGYDYLGNPDLDPERSVNAWGRFSYTKPKLKFSLEGYFNRVSDYIFGQLKPDYEALNLYASGVKQYINLDHATICSANAQVLWQPVPSLEFFNITKYNWGKTAEEEPLPLIPPLNGLLTVSWTKQNYSLQGEAEYSASQHRINRDFGETPTSSYLLFHIRLGYRLPLSGSSLNMHAGIENLLDKAYSEHLDWGNDHRPGRSFYFGLSFNY